MSSTNTSEASSAEQQSKNPPPLPASIDEKPVLPQHPSSSSSTPSTRPRTASQNNRTAGARAAKGQTTKVVIRRVTYFTLSQLRRWRTDQTRRWLLAETGGKLPFTIGSQIVFPRNGPDDQPFVAGEWLCGLDVEKAVKAGVPEKNAETLVQSIQNFEMKCAAVSIQRWSRKMLGKLEIRRLQKMDKHRMNVAKELLATEETYLEQLTIMCDLLYKPLTTEKKYQHILSPDEIRTIFSDVEVIRAVNSSLCDTLKERIQNWTNWTKIGGLFVHMSDYLRVYVDYVKGYSKALELVSSMSESHPFRKFFRDQIKEAPPVYANFNFESLLIVPIQRIPRYKMLLMDLHKNMRPEHPDYQELEDALKKVGDIADWVMRIRRSLNAWRNHFSSLRESLVWMSS